MKKVLCIVLVCVLWALAMSGALAEEAVSPYDQQETIKIGCVYPLTGSKILQGDYTGMGANLAVKQINEAGGLLGKQVELVVEDEGDDQQTTINSYLKLATRDDISAIVHTSITAYVLASAPYVVQYQIPTLQMSSGEECTIAGEPYMWQTRMSDHYQGTLLARYAVTELGMQKPAIVYISNTFGQGWSAFAEEALREEFGIEPTGMFAYNDGEQQYTGIFTQALASGCDGLIVIADPATAMLITSQIHTMEIDLPMIGSAGFTNAFVIDADPEAAEGWYAVTDWTDKVDSPASQAYVEAFEAEYGVTPENMSVYGYDSINIIAEAIRIAGSADPAAIQEALFEVDIDGAMARLSPNEHRSFSSQLYVAKIESGTPNIVGVIDR
ncbi:MAG TPA: ABC transporter substrate-binding protein [Candidatus Pullichristensenella avicola]|nr:ABC transporter substrate-binding protein [Candidatus Pullichristensenella avicola]